MDTFSSECDIEMRGRNVVVTQQVPDLIATIQCRSCGRSKPSGFCPVCLPQFTQDGKFECKGCGVTAIGDVDCNYPTFKICTDCAEKSLVRAVSEAMSSQHVYCDLCDTTHFEVAKGTLKCGSQEHQYAILVKGPLPDMQWLDRNAQEHVHGVEGLNSQDSSDTWYNQSKERCQEPEVVPDDFEPNENAPCVICSKQHDGVCVGAIVQKEDQIDNLASLHETMCRDIDEDPKFLKRILDVVNDPYVTRDVLEEAEMAIGHKLTVLKAGPEYFTQGSLESPVKITKLLGTQERVMFSVHPEGDEEERYLFADEQSARAFQLITALPPLRRGQLLKAAQVYFTKEAQLSLEDRTTAEVQKLMSDPRWREARVEKVLGMSQLVETYSRGTGILLTWVDQSRLLECPSLEALSPEWLQRFPRDNVVRVKLSSLLEAVRTFNRKWLVEGVVAIGDWTQVTGQSKFVGDVGTKLSTLGFAVLAGFLPGGTAMTLAEYAAKKSTEEFVAQKVVENCMTPGHMLYNTSICENAVKYLSQTAGYSWETVGAGALITFAVVVLMYYLTWWCRVRCVKAREAPVTPNYVTDPKVDKEMEEERCKTWDKIQMRNVVSKTATVGAVRLSKMPLAVEKLKEITLENPMMGSIQIPVLALPNCQAMVVHSTKEGTIVLGSACFLTIYCAGAPCHYLCISDHVRKLMLISSSDRAQLGEYCLGKIKDGKWTLVPFDPNWQLRFKHASPNYDIRLYSINPAVAARLGARSAKVKAARFGTAVFVVGFKPETTDLVRTTGITQNGYYPGQILHTASTYGGFSGAPIMQGEEVVAIHRGGADAVNVAVDLSGFAGPGLVVRPFMEESNTPPWAQANSRMDNTFVEALLVADARLQTRMAIKAEKANQQLETQMTMSEEQDRELVGKVRWGDFEPDDPTASERYAEALQREKEKKELDRELRDAERSKHSERDVGDAEEQQEDKVTASAGRAKTLLQQQAIINAVFEKMNNESALQVPVLNAEHPVKSVQVFPSAPTGATGQSSPQASLIGAKEAQPVISKPSESSNSEVVEKSPAVESGHSVLSDSAVLSVGATLNRPMNPTSSEPSERMKEKERMFNERTQFCMASGLPTWTTARSGDGYSKWIAVVDKERLKNQDPKMHNFLLTQGGPKPAPALKAKLTSFKPEGGPPRPPRRDKEWYNKATDEEKLADAEMKRNYAAWDCEQLRLKTLKLDVLTEEEQRMILQSRNAVKCSSPASNTAGQTEVVEPNLNH